MKMPIRRCMFVCFLVWVLLSSCGPAGVEPTARPLPTDTTVAVDTPLPTATVATPTSSPATDTPLPADTAQPTATPVPETEAAPEPIVGNLVAAENGGRVVSVTDELECCPATRLIDGYKLDGGEWWTGEPPEFPQVVVFAPAGDEAHTIDRVVLNPWTSEWRYAWVHDFELYVSATSPDLEEMGWVGSFTLEHFGVDQEFSFEPVQARYVALVVTSQWGGAEGITLNEFEVYPAPKGTVAAEPIYPSRIGNLVAAANGGRIVDYSSEDSSGDWSVDHLTDGRTDTETSWSSAEALNDLQYVVFAFPGEETYMVSGVVLNPYSDGYEEDWIQEFELWGSDDSPDLDAMWALGSFRLEQVGEDQSFTFAPARLRYIALVPRSNYGGTEYALNEFEVYEVGGVTSERLTWAVTLPEDVEPSEEGLERPPTYPPEPDFVPTDFSSRTVATSGESPLENIGFEISQSDLVPAIYHLYGSYFDDLVQTSLTNLNAEPVRVRVEVSVPSYTDAAVETVTIAPGETVEIFQNPPLLPTALDLLHGMRNASLHVRVDYLKEGEPRLLYEGTKPLTIYSRDDFPWRIPGYYNGTVFLATMVTPNDPVLDELLRAAADYSPSGIITFQYRDEYDSDHSVWNRMKAIYEAVADYYDVTYVATGTEFVPAEQEEEGFWLQRLKLPYEVLESHSGMCVELSTLFASVFEKILLRPIIITVPGHVYVGLPISWDSDTYYFLEATMVGQYSFEEAVQYANESFMENALPYIEADRYDAYFWLDVIEAREEGIWPIPWR
jgi:hypothetical protein